MSRKESGRGRKIRRSGTRGFLFEREEGEDSRLGVVIVVLVSVDGRRPFAVLFPLRNPFFAQPIDQPIRSLRSGDCVFRRRRGRSTRC